MLFPIKLDLTSSVRCIEGYFQRTQSVLVCIKYYPLYILANVFIFHSFPLEKWWKVIQQNDKVKVEIQRFVPIKCEIYEQDFLSAEKKDTNFYQI